VAQALGRLLRTRGAGIVAVAGRDPDRTRLAAEFIGGVAAVGVSDLPRYANRVLIAVSDGAIAGIAATLAGAGLSRGIALHTCGGLGVEALAPLAERGVACGTLHPLQTIADPAQGVRDLPGAAFAIDGSAGAVEWAGWLARLAGGRPFRISGGGRAYYHAAAVMASNYLATLVDAASMLMEQAGMTRREALDALGPLARTSLENALREGPGAALTGPVVRGDAETVGVHLKGLRQAPRTVEALYRAAGLHALEMARARNLPPEVVAEIRKLLDHKEDT